MNQITGSPGELNERLLDLVDQPEPRLRAVATTLLIKAVDIPNEEGALMELMVASDGAAVMIDEAAATRARRELRQRLDVRLRQLSLEYGEVAVIRAMRDYLKSQVERWATRAVDDADGRQRAERFLAWAERPGQLEAAQQRGLFTGMDVDDLRRLADTHVRGPVEPETAVAIWAQAERWFAAAGESLSDAVLTEWELARGNG
jgi:hypothetical protein